MESLRELYRIGPGPSSSHTLAVRNACLYYLNLYPNFDEYKVVLCGSLALTGKGHMSDKIIIDTFKDKKVIVDFDNNVYDNRPNIMIFTCGDGLNKEVICSTGGGAIEVYGKPSLVDENTYPHKNLNEIKIYI